MSTKTIIFIKSSIKVYVDAQTYDDDLTVATLVEELEHISPYFWLERMVFLVVSSGKSLKTMIKNKKLRDLDSMTKAWLM